LQNRTVGEGREAGRPPVQAPNKYELLVNLKIAKALGLTVPQSSFARDDQLTNGKFVSTSSFV
jgi:hypothetical protein